MKNDRAKSAAETRVQTPFGTLRLTSDGAALTAAAFTEEQADASPARDAVLRQAAEWVLAYLRGEEAPLPPLAEADTPFRMAVREELLKVPFGETVTYGALAQAVAERLGSGRPCARAVGGALHSNPLPLFVPCHRVISADGGLTGFACGLDRKAALLAFERKCR